MNPDPRSQRSVPRRAEATEILPLARSLDDLKDLHRLCRDGRLYEVEDWIRDARPIQLPRGFILRGRKLPTALQIALESGQHSLVLLLLRSGYRLELENESPLDRAMKARRWDLLDLLLQWNADPRQASLTVLFETYNIMLFDKFRQSGVDLSKGRELAEALGYHSSNKPLFGFVKRCRTEEPRFQRALDMALAQHTCEGNEKGILLALWAGADPHARVPNLAYGDYNWELGEYLDDDSECETALDEAVRRGRTAILARFQPDPSRVDFDKLYENAANKAVVDVLERIRPPHDLTSILTSQCWGIDCRWPEEKRTAEALIGVLSCGVRWEAAETKKIEGIRFNLQKLNNYDLKEILLLLRQPEVCAPENFRELTRTTSMQKRMLDMRLITLKPKPVSKAEKVRREVTRIQREASSLAGRFDRSKLYEEVWTRPVQHVAKDYGVSGVYLGRVCRVLRIPVPKRGYWARVQAGRRPARSRLPVSSQRYD